MSNETDYLTIEFSVDSLKAIGISLGMSLNSEGASERLRKQWTEIYSLLVEAIKNVSVKENQVKKEVSKVIEFKVGDYTFNDGNITQKTENKDGCNHPYKGRYYCPLKKWFMKEPCNHENMKECTHYDKK